MLHISRILHANDFSPASITAMKYSMRLAHSLSVPLDILHVVPSIGPARFSELDLSAGKDDPDEIVRKVTRAFEQITHQIDGVDVQYVLGRSPLPGPAILERAMQQKASLIVLGAHGLRAAREGQLGSVAAELVQRASCPVMLVPERVPESAADEEVERIVTYVSFAHLVEPVIVFAFQMARLFGAHLDILALTNGRALNDEIDLPERSTEDLKSALHRQLLRTVESESKESAEPFGDVKVHLKSGYDGDTILSFASERKSDLLVIEAPGLAAFESPLERMVERIVNDAPCPVIVVNTCSRGDVTRSGKKRRRLVANSTVA